jgi:hypothetical protein
MVRGSVVTSPDGDRWQVGRRWMDRPLPDLRHRFRTSRSKSVGDVALDPFVALDVLDSPVAALVVAAAVLLLFLILLPLIGLLFELLVVLLLVWSGIAARLVLGRPWIVEAVNLDNAEHSTAFAIKGWRRSGRAIDELAQAIATGGTPTLHASD